MLLVSKRLPITLHSSSILIHECMTNVCCDLDSWTLMPSSYFDGIHPIPIFSWRDRGFNWDWAMPQLFSMYRLWENQILVQMWRTWIFLTVGRRSSLGEFHSFASPSSSSKHIAQHVTHGGSCRKSCQYQRKSEIFMISVMIDTSTRVPVWCKGF